MLNGAVTGSYVLKHITENIRVNYTFKNADFGLKCCIMKQR